MGMKIEVIATTWYTVYLSDEDVEKVKQWIKDHEDNLPSFDMKKNVSESSMKCVIEIIYILFGQIRNYIVRGIQM